MDNAHGWASVLRQKAASNLQYGAASATPERFLAAFLQWQQATLRDRSKTRYTRRVHANVNGVRRDYKDLPWKFTRFTQPS